MLREVERERGRYISAALTIVMAWLKAGSPAPSADHIPLDGFHRWDGLCRQSLMWLDMPDPATSTLEALEEDPDRVLLGRLLTAWHASFDRRPTKVREAIATPNVSPDLYETMQDIAGEKNGIDSQALGTWILRHEGQRVDGLKFVRVAVKTAAARWRVEQVAQSNSQ